MYKIKEYSRDSIYVSTIPTKPSHEEPSSALEDAMVNDLFHLAEEEKKRALSI